MIPDTPLHVLTRMEARDYKRDRQKKKTKEKEIKLDAQELAKTHSTMSLMNLKAESFTSDKKVLFGGLNKDNQSNKVESIIETTKPKVTKSEALLKPEPKVLLSEYEEIQDTINDKTDKSTNENFVGKED